MKRLTALPLLLIAACSPAAPDSDDRLLYAGEGRDRLCMAGDRIGFIAYGDGDTNCTVRGRVDRAGGQAQSIIPDGDHDCRVDVQQQGETLRLGAVAAACSYYCGPGASFAGKAFTENASVSPAVDFAGDPLC